MPGHAYTRAEPRGTQEMIVSGVNSENRLEQRNCGAT
jgi:hypothetical protein